MDSHDEIEKNIKPKGRPQKKETALDKLRKQNKESVEDAVKQEVVLLQEEKVPPPVMTLTQYKQLQEKRPDILPPKRPMSEAQKANIQRLIEANKARREAKNLPQPTIPEEIPEGYKAVYIQQPKEAKPKKVTIQPQPPPQPQYPSELMEMMKRFNERLDQLSTREKPQKERKPPARKKFTAETSESEPQEESSGYDTSDTEYIDKYKKKAEKRIEAVKQIETKLKQAIQPVKPKGRYDNMSLF